MTDEKAKPKNRQRDGGAKERYLRVQSDIAAQQERAERGAGGINTEEAEELACEINRLLKEAAQAEAGNNLCSATKQFDIVIRKRGSRLLISAVKRDTVLEENPLSDLADESL